MKLSELAQFMAKETRDFVKNEIATIRTELVAMIEEVRSAKTEILQGPKGDPGEKGEPGDRGEKGDKGEAGEKGADGRDGKDADPEVIASLVAKAVSEIPAPRDGKDGVDGKDGRDGQDAAPIDTVALAKDVLALIPVPRDGRDGVATTDELIALVNAKVAELLPDAVAKAVADTVAALPLLEYKGVWKDGGYVPGHMVTWGGNLWHCNTATTDKPGETPSWTLAVRRGRDGKDARR